MQLTPIGNKRVLEAETLPNGQRTTPAPVHPKVAGQNQDQVVLAKNKPLEAPIGKPQGFLKKLTRTVFDGFLGGVGGGMLGAIGAGMLHPAGLVPGALLGSIAGGAVALATHSQHWGKPQNAK